MGIKSIIIHTALVTRHNFEVLSHPFGCFSVYAPDAPGIVSCTAPSLEYGAGRHSFITGFQLEPAILERIFLAGFSVRREGCS